MEIDCVAIVGKANNPLYIKNFTSSDDLKYHYVVNTSLDVIEERVQSAPKSPDMYLGLLYSMEDLRVYGYITNTKIKIVMVLNAYDTTLKDNDIRMMFSQLHQAYIKLVCNPFFNPESNSTISSKKFEQNVLDIVQKNF